MADLVEAYQAGDSAPVVARRFDIDRSTVMAHLERAGVARRPCRPSTCRATSTSTRGGTTTASMLSRCSARCCRTPQRSREASRDERLRRQVRALRELRREGYIAEDFDDDSERNATNPRH